LLTRHLRNRRPGQFFRKRNHSKRAFLVRCLTPSAFTAPSLLTIGDEDLFLQAARRIWRIDQRLRAIRAGHPSRAGSLGSMGYYASAFLLYSRSGLAIPIQHRRADEKIDNRQSPHPQQSS